MKPLVNTFSPDFDYIESGERLHVPSVCELTAMPSVHISLTTSGHLDGNMVDGGRVTDRGRAQIDLRNARVVTAGDLFVEVIVKAVFTVLELR